MGDFRNDTPASEDILYKVVNTHFTENIMQIQLCHPT